MRRRFVFPALVGALAVVSAVILGPAVAQKSKKKIIKVQHSDSKVKCEGCHTVDGWSLVHYADHDKTGYPLKGEHRIAACVGCHPHSLTDPINDHFVQGLPSG